MVALDEAACSGFSTDLGKISYSPADIGDGGDVGVGGILWWGDQLWVKLESNWNTNKSLFGVVGDLGRPPMYIITKAVTSLYKIP